MSGRYIKLSEVYGRYGLDILLNKVYAMTGMTIDNYALVSMEAFPAIIDALGGISYNVPCDMRYVDHAGGININIPKGAHRLDGQGVLDVLMFNNYTDGGSRSKTTAELIRKFISTFISIGFSNNKCKIFKTVHSLTCLRNIDLIAVLHNISLLLLCPGTLTGAKPPFYVPKRFHGFSTATIALPD